VGNFLIKTCIVCLSQFYAKRDSTVSCSRCWIEARKINQKKWREKKRALKIDESLSKLKSDLLEKAPPMDNCEVCPSYKIQENNRLCKHSIFSEFEGEGRLIYCLEESRNWCPNTRFRYYRPQKEF
jgi:hypothetical protein